MWMSEDEMGALDDRCDLRAYAFGEDVSWWCGPRRPNRVARTALPAICLFLWLKRS